MILLKKIAYGIIILLIFPFSAFSSANIHLSGKIHQQLSAYNNAYFICKAYKHNAVRNQEIFTVNFKALIKDNSFKLDLSLEDELTYVTFSVVDTSGKLIMFDSGNDQETPFLLKKGDNLNLILLPNYRIDFKGIGADRLSCEQNLYMLQGFPDGALNSINDLNNLGDYKESYTASYRFLKVQIEMANAILKSYESRIPLEERELIKFDILGKLYSHLFFALYVTARTSTQDQIPFALSFLKELKHDLKEPDTSYAALSSMFYTYALYLKELSDVSFQNRETKQKLSSKQLFDVIKYKYTGDLRDKMFLVSALDPAGAQKKGTGDRIKESLLLMKNGESKTLLEEYQHQNMVGIKAFPFDLPDNEGKRWKLSDFKGKIIIADFWFNGCHGCLEMPGALNPIYEKFKHDNKVVWLSINVDNDKITWYKGLKNGLYTFPGQVHLSTFEYRLDNTLLKHYNYNSFPQLLVINQQGEVEDSQPLDPRQDNGVFLDKLIKNMLR